MYNIKVLSLYFATTLFIAVLGCEDDESRHTVTIIDRDKGANDGDTDERAVEQCVSFPEYFDESAAFSFNDPSFGQVVQYTEFKGLAEGHAYADAIFDLAILKKFGAAFQPSVVDLSGRESSFDTCAYCIRFSEGVTMKNGVAVSTDRLFMPASGTLTFESLSNKAGDPLKFQIDAVMVEVTLGEGSESIPVPGGCSFELKSHTRSTVIRN